MELGGAKNGDFQQAEVHKEPNPDLESLMEGSNGFHDDFLEQMLSNLRNTTCWPDISSSIPNPNLILQQQLPSLPSTLASGNDSLDPRPLHEVAAHGSSPPSLQGAADGCVEALFNGNFNAQNTKQQPFQAGAMAGPSFGGASPSTGGTLGQAPPQRQRVRARRGQATDPHSIAERLRRERIAERMKALQELVPNANKTDKASMLDEIIDYVKFLQLQVKVLSMSRLGGGAAGVAHLSSEGGGIVRNANGNPAAGSSNDGMSVTEHQVVKLMEEDMGSAMQYLQGKGLCLMPISLATAISTATSHTRTTVSLHNNSHRHHPQANGNRVANGNGGGEGPSSPNLSQAVTVQSANLVNGDGSVKESNLASN